MKRTVLIAAVAALFPFCSCQNEDKPISVESTDPVFTATIDNSATKTTVNASTGKVEWEMGDEITVTDGSSVSVKYTVSAIDGNGKATFTKKSGETNMLGAGNYKAVYGTAPAATQTYSATAPSLPMEATSATTTLKFTVTCGLLEISLQKESENVKKIAVSDGTNTYSLDCGAGESINETKKFFIAVPAATYTSIVITNTDDNECEKTGLSIAVAANHITPAKSTDFVFDLSKRDGVIETANSYIVTKAGKYKFKATQGNSSTSVTPASVVVLWESTGTSYVPSAGTLVNTVTYSGEYINFIATNVKGNAVIAAYSGSGGTGNILWSWHIWLTDKPVDQVYKNSAGTMMDRNLGATTATNLNDVGILGLHYQWGRKDPFMNKYSRATIDFSVFNGTAGIDGSIQNPTTFIYGNSDWTSKNDGLWGDTKTKYDPCPPGYRVPGIGLWSNAGFPNSKSPTSGFACVGRDFSSCCVGSVTCIYPAAGVHDNSNLDQYYDNYGGYWSCTTSGIYANDFTFQPGGTVNTTDTGNRAFAGSVRCLKIE